VGIINPPIGAIQDFLWVDAQEGIKAILDAISTAQEVFDENYAFKNYTNLYRPSIEQIENIAMTNIRIANVTTVDEDNFNATHRVTYNVDCYIRGNNEDDPDNPGSLVPADEVAVQRLHYLVAMVYYGITDLANFYKNLGSGKIIPGKIGIVFNPVEDSENSYEPYAPAQITFECDFPYTYKDLENLPDLEAVKITLQNWAAQIFN